MTKTKTLSAVAAVLTAALLLGGCSSKPTVQSEYASVDRYTQYLKVAAPDDDLFEPTYTDDDIGGYMIYLKNTDDERFCVATFNIYESASSTAALYSIDTSLMRPGGQMYFRYTGPEPSYYGTSGDKCYTLNYDASIDYDFIEDVDVESGASYVDILYGAGYTVEDLESVAKREYAIAVLTDYLVEQYYYFDSTLVWSADYPDFPDLASALYSAEVDYDARAITLYSLENGAKTEVSVLTMD